MEHENSTDRRRSRNTASRDGRERRTQAPRNQRTSRKRTRPGRKIFLMLLLAAVFFAGFGAGRWSGKLDTDELPFMRRYVDLSAIKAPDWIRQDFITVNRYSRPGTKLNRINDIVVHYVANPGTDAEQNRSYFQGLKDQKGSGTVSASCHFIIGLDGEILQIIPMDEKAFASNNRNSDTIAIECCHPGKDGKFSEATYQSLVRLTAWLCGELDLTENDVIRHYDVNGKLCPKYYVEHEDAWTGFLQDVRKAR